MKTVATYTGAAPHSLSMVKSHLRVFHDLEDDLIQSIYDAALQRIESRTRRYLRDATITYTYTTWRSLFLITWGYDPDTLAINYVDNDDNTKAYTGDIIAHGKCVEIGDKPSDYTDNAAINLVATTTRYNRADLDNMILMLTAQWYENRGDQNIKGTPEWIERVCFNHSWQSF